MRVSTVGALKRGSRTNGDPVYAYPVGVTYMYVEEGGWPGDLRSGAIIQTLVLDKGPSLDRSFIPEAFQICIPVKNEEGDGTLGVLNRNWGVDDDWWTEWEGI